MRKLSKLALDTAQARGATYADIRVVSDRMESIGVKNGNVSSLSARENRGFGIRVIADGAWGFASSSLISDEEIVAVAETAVSIAKASARVKEHDVVLSPLKGVEDSWKVKYDKDPFAIKLEDKIGLLLEADKLMRANPAVRVADAGMRFWRENQVFASTDGAYIEQEITESGAGITATAIGPGEMQRRSYPNAAGGDFATAGYEFIESLNLVDHAQVCAEEAAQLLTAAQCPSGEKTIILDGSQMQLQVHESCGHPIELDRVFGTEASYAGTSFITPDKLGKLQYGSPEVNIVADATAPGGLGSYGYDDEGVPAQRIPIIERGRFVNYLTSRETAPVIGQESNGTMRADGWNRTPIIRMSNINLEPGDWTLDEMIKDTKDGIYMVTNKSWSIDDKRLNFQFGTEIAWEITDGSLGRMLKNPTYTGITPEFWNSCTAVADRDFWHIWGTPNCGKGEPGQMAHVGHGTAPARFENVKVGVGRW